MLQYFETITPLVGRIDLLNKMRYILEVVALLETHKLERTLDDFSHNLSTYAVMDRNHSNCPSLNLSQNVSER